MPWINARLHDNGPTAKALCLGLVAALAVASFSGTASAAWGNENDRRPERRDEHRDEHQGWNNGSYRAPPVVYQRNNAPAYYAPPVVYGSGVNLNINLP
jgi:hypothetical protein